MDSARFIDFDGLGFNPLEVVDREYRMAHLDVTCAIWDIFTAACPELGDIQADRIRRAVKDSFIEAGWGDFRRSIQERITHALSSSIRLSA